MAASLVKAVEYLGAGRLKILLVHRDRVIAECRGTDLYQLGRTKGRWWCSCPARGDCCHLGALRLVVAPIEASPSGGAKSPPEQVEGADAKKYPSARLTEDVP